MSRNIKTSKHIRPPRKTMEQPGALLLPPEMWNHVFRYLSAIDKFSLRACCKYFQELVDHRSLWKGWTVVLVFQKSSYNRRFWTTLRRRGVTSVVLRGGKDVDCERLSRSLPALSTIVIERNLNFDFCHLKHFPNMKRLVIRNTDRCGMTEASRWRRPLQLTHLSMCYVASLNDLTVLGFISAVCQLKELTSLACHHLGFSVNETYLVVQTILAGLPKLKHLSLSMATCPYEHPTPNQGLFGGAHGQTVASPLSSFELVGCGDLLVPGFGNAMRLMPGLRSLAVFYSASSQRRLSPLYTWLRDLPQLSTLVIVNGPPMETHHVTSIPTTVTSLTLRVPGLSFDVMAAVSVRVPNLLHLHLDPWPSYLGAHTAQIPPLFPKLKRLKLRHEHVPERDFLDLHQLLDLEHLEILDSSPHLSELTGKLQALTKHRFHISRFRTHLLSCPCVYQVY